MMLLDGQNQTALYFGGLLDSELPERIASGLHPRVEYLEFLNQYPVQCVTFQNVINSTSPFVGVARSIGGLSWGLAMLGCVQPSLTNILTTGEDMGFPLALIQRLTGGSSPLSIILHGSYLGSRKGYFAVALLRSLPSVRFLCLSESLRTRLIENHRVPASRVTTVGYGVDTRFFRPDPLVPVQPRQVASAGMANRDYQTLAAAVSGLDVDVKIAADSAWFKSDLDIASQTLPPNVEARSYGDYIGLRRLYAESACVVVPLYEAVHACGYAVIAEAMAMGKPVITSRISGHSDYITEGETGFYVPPGDAAALRARIVQLLEDPALALRMGRSARCLIEKRYTLEAYNCRVAAAMGLAE